MAATAPRDEFTAPGNMAIIAKVIIIIIIDFRRVQHVGSPAPL